MGTTVFERQRPAASVILQSLAEHAPERVLARRPSRRAAVPRLTGTARRPRRRRRRLRRPVDRAARQAPRPGARVVLLEARTVGGRHPAATADSARRASRTAARTAQPLPDEIDELDRLGMANLDAHGRRHRRARHRRRLGAHRDLAVATEPHQLAWLDEWATDAASRGDEGMSALDRGARCRHPSHRPPSSARCGTRTPPRWCTRASSPRPRARRRGGRGRDLRGSPVRRLEDDGAGRDSRDRRRAGRRRSARPSRPTCSRPC